MRCKVGDIAAIVGGLFPENYGRIVEVLSWDSYDRMWLCRAQSCIRGERWHTTGYRQQRDFPAGHEGLAADQDLRPLRPGDAADETLTWAGKPQETVREALTAIRETLT